MLVAMELLPLFGTVLQFHLRITISRAVLLTFKLAVFCDQKFCEIASLSQNISPNIAKIHILVLFDSTFFKLIYSYYLCNYSVSIILISILKLRVWTS